MRISESKFRKVVQREIQNVLQEQRGGKFPADINVMTSLKDDFRFIWENEEFQRTVVNGGVTTIHLSFSVTQSGWLCTFEMEYDEQRVRGMAQDHNVSVDRWLDQRLYKFKNILNSLNLDLTGRSEITDGYIILDGIRPSQ